MHEKVNLTKANIVTIYDPIPNYGNRLQNYAVQNVLENLGLQVSTLSFEKPIFTGKKKLKAIAQKLSNYTLPGDKGYWKYFYAKVQIFERFNRDFIKAQRIKSISQIHPADYYVLGSDQVWNTAWYREGDMKKDLFLLTFAQPEQKVCFAPSFGTDTLPSEWIEWFQKYLKIIPNLSVREEAGQDIINKLTGRDATVLIDPTLMLNADDWTNIAKMPKKIDTSCPYILTYFLGKCPDRLGADIKAISEQDCVRVYNLMDRNQPEVYVSGPSEFVYLVSHAKIVLTDSFHACAFSFLFGKPFLVYAREGDGDNMISRINTLLKTFHLERKYVGKCLPSDLLECNYQIGYEALNQERLKALVFLKSAMNLE